MHCLTDAELHDVAAGESSAAATAHVSGCDRCRDRLDALRRTLDDVARTVNAINLPPAASTRIRESIEAGYLARGATSLRAAPAGPPWRAIVSTLATAAVLAIVIFGVLPRFVSPTTLSAAQVLGKSLQTMTGTSGVEFLEYELFVNGPTYGAWRIEQLIDHRTPSRYRVAAYSQDGVLHHAFSQDPGQGHRSELTRVDGRNYIVQINAAPSVLPSMPQMAQALIESTISTMQAMSDPTLTVVEGDSGRQYVVEIPVTAAVRNAATMELQHARAVVDGADFRLRKLEATGTIFRQAFSVSFKLLGRQVRNAADVSAAEFEISPAAGDVVLRGMPTLMPPGEFVTTIVRELAAARGF